MNELPHTYNLHEEIAVRYQGATGNLSTEAFKDTSVPFFVSNC